MAASFKLPLVLFLSSLFLHAALAEIICEDLPKDVCAFSICSSGQRCILETETKKDGNVEYQCKTSEVVVERMADYIETDECVRACGVDRNVVGISSDALFEPEFAAKLCSPDCYQKCPNIVDLYFNLAAGEGAFLPNLCDVHRSNPHRAMVQLLSSGAGEEAESPLSAPTIASLTAASPDYAPSEGPVSAESPISATTTTIYSAAVPAQSPSSAMTPTASSPEAFEEDFEGA
ncbi:hypothetical protein LWI28_016704 [Acer negundo]|uniref:PAR1 protein n=1 Tax=Acer negundo TaxID=4023 RepID=A0AAD5NFL2_ACENE|nr:hypothetical protein LWI28_016704 [Acer negundo]KAK4858270.1 hypothetical protein QYF36_013637 [Acer negundo]